MSKTTPQKAPRKPTARSRVTNGKLGDMDGRGKWARRFADLIELYSLDVALNPATLPATMQNLIRRAATLTVELERAEATFAKDGKADPAAFRDYQTATNTLRRLLEDIQIKGGAAEHLKRPGGQEADDGRFIREITAKFTVEDWSLCGDGRDSAERRAIARRIAFSISEAKRMGTALDPTLASLAVDVGVAEYADEEGNVIELDAHRH